MEENEMDGVDPTNDNGEAEEPENNDGNSDDNQSDDLTAKNKALYARAKKAEQEAKKLREELEKTKKEPNKDSNQLNGDYLTREEAILMNKGIITDDEDLAMLKRIQAGYKAEGKEMTLSQIAEQDKYFKAHLSEKQAEARKEKAKQFGPAGGGGGFVKTGDFKPGMTEDEHRAAWNKKVGR